MPVISTFKEATTCRRDDCSVRARSLSCHFTMTTDALVSAGIGVEIVLFVSVRFVTWQISWQIIEEGKERHDYCACFFTTLSELLYAWCLWQEGMQSAMTLYVFQLLLWLAICLMLLQRMKGQNAGNDDSACVSGQLLSGFACDLWQSMKGTSDWQDICALCVDLPRDSPWWKMYLCEQIIEIDSEFPCNSFLWWYVIPYHVIDHGEQSAILKLLLMWLCVVLSCRLWRQQVTGTTIWLQRCWSWKWIGCLLICLR